MGDQCFQTGSKATEVETSFSVGSSSGPRGACIIGSKTGHMDPRPKPCRKSMATLRAGAEERVIHHMLLILPSIL